MYKQCQTEQSAQRQRELEQGLLDMMCKRKFSDITVSELCQEMGVPRKAFYRYFDSKEGALYALIDHTLMEMESGYMVFPGKRTSGDALNTMKTVFSSWKEKRQLLDALQYSNMTEVLIQRSVIYSSNHHTIPTILRKQDKQLEEYTNTFVNAGLVALLTHWHYNGYQTSVEDMAKLALRLFREPLFNPIVE